MLRALLVDPDADTRDLYAEFLRRSGWDLDVAEDGRKALAKAFTRSPDVIVTETRVPGISGYDLCRRLRADTATRNIPVVFVTGDAYPAQVKQALVAGADAVLVKPCLPEQLLKEIRLVLQHARELRSRAEAARTLAADHLTRARRLMERSRVNDRRVALSRAHRCRDTPDLLIAPLALRCPNCDRALRYVKSHLGGVSARYQEQWDDLECPAGCGKFQYRHRTRRLRRVT